MATQLISEVIAQFKLEIPLQSLFESPTVEEMATVIIEYQRKQLGENEFQRILDKVESLTDEEAMRIVDEKITKDPLT